MGEVSPAGPPASAHKVVDALASLRTGTGREIASRAGVAYSTATQALRALERAGLVARYGDDPRQRSWRLCGGPDATANEPDGPGAVAPPGGDAQAAPEAPADTGAPAPAGVPASAAAGIAGGGAPRRRKGQLEAEVLAVLSARPDTRFTVVQIARLVDAEVRGCGVAPASVGAVGNALHKLAGAGRLVRVADRPAAFVCAPGTGQPTVAR